MFGFRPQLSTQDVMLQLSEDVLHPSHHKRARAILALDLTKAFDNVHHTAILDALSSLHVGPRVHAYVTAFLAHRTAEISYGPLSSPSFSLGNKGTPQGSVLSPLLFNVTLFPLARALRTIPALSHAFYADDITLWVTTGNLGDMETTLQAGVDAVATHARSVGLSCSPAKSELLLFLPRGMAPLSPSPLTVSLDGTPIPLVSTLRILGLFLQSNGKHTTLITRLTNTVHQTIRLIRRIANRHHGMREHDLRRLVQAFVLSRFIYSLPYIFLSRTEEDKVNSLIRQAYKSALSLPTSTSTARLLSMGVHNSLTELTEAHRTAQLLRLSRTRPGRALLSTLKLSPLTPLPTSLPIPSHVYSLLTVNPLPKNMHPEHHPSRRAARASALWRQYERQPAVAYVDAAPYRHYPAHALAVTDNSFRPTLTASVYTSTSVEAEEAAIALAITQTSAEYIFSDSKPAVYNYAVGRVASPASGILRSDTVPSRPIQIIWVPAHAAHPGNEAANSIARDSTDRASPPPPGMDTRDALLTYHDITLHYRLSRLTFPPPHKSLSQHHQHLWRHLQAHTFLTPARLALFHPGTYSPACRLCDSSRADYDHILFSCPAHLPPASWHLTSPQQWEAALSSTEPDLQLRLVTWAEDVATRHGLDATTGSLKAAHNAAF